MNFFKATLFLLILLTSSHISSQDYNRLANMFYKNDPVMGKKVIKNTLESSNQEHIGIELLEKYDNFKNIEIQAKEKLKRLEQNFKRENPNPDNQSSCKKAASLKKLIRANRIIADLAKTTLNMCINNRYNNSRCIKERRDYNESVIAVNELVRESNEYVIYCKNYIRKYENNYKTYKIQEEEISQNVNYEYKKNTDEFRAIETKFLNIINGHGN